MAAIYSSLISSQIDTTWIALFSTHPTRPRQPNNISPMDGHANSIAGQVCACSHLVLIRSVDWVWRMAKLLNGDWGDDNLTHASAAYDELGRCLTTRHTSHPTQHSTRPASSTISQWLKPFHLDLMLRSIGPTKCKNQVSPFDITAKPSQGSKNGFRSLWGSLVSKTKSRNLIAAPPRLMEIKTTHSHVRGRFLVRNFSLS